MIVQFIGLLVLSQRTILTVEVTNEQLKVGSAHIDRKYLGTITALTAEQMRQLRGPLSDPAGYMALRFWLSRGVKVEINDPNDPTPYWLISSKKAQPLAAALQDKDKRETIRNLCKLPWRLHPLLIGKCGERGSNVNK